MKAVLFDLDQTLLDRSRSLQKFLEWQCRGMLRPYLSDQDAFIQRFLALDANGTVWKDRVYATLIAEFALNSWSATELLSVYENCFGGFCLPMAGAPEAVNQIASVARLGLISNGKSPFQERNFRALGFHSLFDSIIISEAVALRKPDARIFQLGCGELGVAPSETVFVGDNPIADIEGAKAAGLRTVFIPSELHPQCDAADQSCAELSLLPEIIRNFGASGS